MNVDIRAVHFTLSGENRTWLEKKLGRIHNAENMIVDMMLSITKDKDYQAEATVNFRWGVSIHVNEQDFDFNTACDKMIDKLEAKINKEREKFKEKRGKKSEKSDSSSPIDILTKMR
jgi:putative sigma-54 modulation protein